MRTQVSHFRSLRTHYENNHTRTMLVPGIFAFKGHDVSV